MKMFKKRDSSKKQQKQVYQDMNVEDMPPLLTRPNQDPVYTYDQRSPLQQPAPATAPPRKSRPPQARRSERQSQPPPVETQQLQQAPVKQSREHRHHHTVQSQPPMQAPVRYSEAPVETLRQQPPPPKTYAADPPQVYATSQAAPTLKEPPPPLRKDSVDALKESFGNMDPAVQMARNAVTRELVKQFIADIWNRGDLDLIPQVCAKGIRFNGSEGMDRVGHDGFKKMVMTIRGYLEDYHCEIHSMVVEGNKAFCRIRFMGRHTGRLLGYEPTGRHVSWMGAMEFTVQDSKIIKVWELGDMVSLEQQLRD